MTTNQIRAQALKEAEEALVVMRNRLINKAHDIGCSSGAIVLGDAIRSIRALAAVPAQPELHSDDIAVDQFAQAMKDKLRIAREQKGRGGWQECSTPDLVKMMFDHIAKGDMRDVANFAMMLWHNENGDPVHIALDELAVLRAENERLRGALQALHDSYVKVCPAANIVAQQARAALAQKEG